ncbi:hypothetical protein COLO4_07393 [Corchorus olitorius]|uniref:Uncharacterized protein n=1 Tax=Corchorus olitorius TaxID=93759 RepID=A0A1R3KK06_9ROSI|nr:hypothetical protein COLO4_07393 [Corchorus olitorius]
MGGILYSVLDHSLFAFGEHPTLCTRRAFFIHARRAFFICARAFFASRPRVILHSRSARVLRFAFDGHSAFRDLANSSFPLEKPSIPRTRELFTSRSASILCFATSSILQTCSRSILCFALDERSTLCARRAFFVWHSVSVLRFAFSESSTFSIGDRCFLTGSILLPLGIYALRSASVLRLALGERSPLTRSILLSMGIYALRSERVTLFRSAIVLRLALEEQSTLRIWQAFYICDRVLRLALGGRSPLRIQRVLYICDRRSFSVWHSTSVLRFTFGERSTFAIGECSLLTGSILLSLGIYALRSASILRLAFSERSTFAIDDCSPLTGSILLSLGSTFCTRRAFSAWHSASVLRSALDERSTFAISDCSPLTGAFSFLGYIHFALNEHSPLGTRRAFYLCNRRSFSSHREHSPLLGDLRFVLGECSPLGTRRSFSAWHSTSVLRFAFGERFTFAIEDRSPLGTRRAFYASYSTSVLHLRSLIVLGLALAERSTLRIRRAFYICDRRSFSYHGPLRASLIPILGQRWFLPIACRSGAILGRGRFLPIVRQLALGPFVSHSRSGMFLADRLPVGGPYLVEVGSCRSLADWRWAP